MVPSPTSHFVCHFLCRLGGLLAPTPPHGCDSIPATNESWIRSRPCCVGSSGRSAWSIRMKDDHVQLEGGGSTMRADVLHHKERLEPDPE